MEAKLYVILGSHACRAGILVLEHKGIDYELVELPTALHPFALRLHGFAGNPTRVPGARGQVAPHARDGGPGRHGAGAQVRRSAGEDQPRDRPVSRPGAAGAAHVSRRSRSPRGGRGSRALGRRSVPDGGAPPHTGGRPPRPGRARQPRRRRPAGTAALAESDDQDCRNAPPRAVHIPREREGRAAAAARSSPTCSTASTAGSRPAC